jgi:hypothetical protein
VTTNIQYSFNLSVDRGPSISFADKFDAEAYDKISVTIPKSPAGSAKEYAVDVQPVETSRVQILCIISDHYDESHKSADKTKKLSYKSEKTEILLDRAHVLIGLSLTGLLDEKSAKLKFTNTTDNDAQLEILVGRMAIAA